MSVNSVTSDDLIPLYFQPEQLIFHANENLRNKPKKIQDLIEWANNVASETENSIKISVSDDIFDFSPGENLDPKKKSLLYQKRTKLRQRRPDARTKYKSPFTVDPHSFSMVFADVKSNNWPGISTYSKDVTDEVSAARANALKKILPEMLELAILLDSRRKDSPVALEVVSLNWLMNGSREDPGTTGGPGGRPFPVDNSKKNNYHFLSNLDQNSDLPGFLNGIPHQDSGKDVVVAILDTSYSKDKLEKLHKTWVLNKSQKEQHPIIEALLGDEGALRNTDGQLRVYTDPAVTNYLPGLIIDGHDYDMTDHGLFVAGIINSLAPKAELHLYQVLNEHGLGDMRSVARALQQVFNDFQERKLVVNLSLTMNIPLEKGHLKEDHLSNDAIDIGAEILKHKTFNERQAQIFESICDLVYTLDSRIIAAAGNESKSKKPRLGALYPAAFDRVLGVGALAYDDGSVSPASYSNLADKPTNDGIATFGGEAKEKGILGVYVGPFPDGSKNENGFAWWSGTSFATPIISGITAAVLSKMPGAITEEAIIKLFEAQSKFTNDDEDVLTVAQGPK